MTVINQGTSSQQQVTTDAAGAFNVADLQPGSYGVLVEANGFNTQRRAGVVVYAHNVVNVDTRLAVGETKTSVEGDRSDASRSTPRLRRCSYPQTGTQLSEVPTNATLQDTNQYFALYTPSVGINSGGGIHAFGLRTVDTRVANDGIIEMADADGVGGGPIGPAPGAVAEVTTVTNGANAEYQEPANVIIVTKSGTNSFHGLASYTWNGSDLNARNFFSSSVPFANFNDFTGNVGGPIRRNKLFFFGNYEALRSRSQSVLNANVPLAAWRTGDFSGLSTAIMNPLTGQPFPAMGCPPASSARSLKPARVFSFPCRISALPRCNPETGGRFCPVPAGAIPETSASTTT